jgi:hypothetical protein
MTEYVRYGKHRGLFNVLVGYVISRRRTGTNEMVRLAITAEE